MINPEWRGNDNFDFEREALSKVKHKEKLRLRTGDGMRRHIKMVQIRMGEMLNASVRTYWPEELELANRVPASTEGRPLVALPAMSPIKY